MTRWPGSRGRGGCAVRRSNGRSAIRVVLADDHPALRVGLRVLLEREPDIVVVGEAGDGPEALRLIKGLLPTVAVVDCLLPGLAGAEVAAEVQREGWPTRILAVSAYSDEKYVRSMLAAGAVGYLLKDEAPSVIVAAVRAAAQGQGWFSQAVLPWLRGEIPGGVDLTDREIAVLRLVAKGKANKEIARELSVTERTVEFHLGNVRGKLGVTSRVEVAVWAREHGLDA